ncbi:MAG TPA: heavy metal-binding domain-containing protein [Acidothermaceae bacterium]|nr:heavy metal-binding domain-containing protein [Acidothermaceae bacterium]
MSEPGESLAGLSRDEIDARSIAELDAGRLPLRAQQRLATMRADAAFTSSLSVDEHHAIRSVGFSPVGQVMGAAVVHPGAYGFGNCGYYGSFGAGMGFAWGQAPIAIASQVEGALHEARANAVNRLVQECVGLGGDGVVGVRLTMERFVAGGLEVQAIGTAVRADGETRPPWPFTSDLSGQDFAKLLLAGWLPAGLVMGTAVLLRHDDYTTAWQTGSWNNTEVTGVTQLVTDTRERARDTLRRDAARFGARHVVLRDLSLSVFHQNCQSGREGEDHVAQSVAWGTAIVALRDGHRTQVPRPLPMLRLNPS